MSMDENETNEPVLMSVTESASIGPMSSRPAPLADAPQQQADANERIMRDSGNWPVVSTGGAVANPDFPRNPSESIDDYVARLNALNVPTALATASSFAARIAAAKFEHREQGHDETMKLLDEMYAAIERLEAERG